MPRTLLAGLLALIVASPAFAGKGPRWCSDAVVSLEIPGQGKTPSTPKTAAPQSEPTEPAQLERVSVRWELDLRGAVATGTLIETYRSDASAPIPVQYRFYPAPGFQVVETTMAIDGVETELETAAPTAASGKRRGRRPLPGVEHSETFELPTGALVEIRVSLQAQLGFQDGWFELSLPTVTQDCRRQAGKVSKDEPQLGVPLEVSLKLHHEDASIEVDGLTHAVSEWSEDRGTAIELSEPALVGEGPFVLRYRLLSGPEDEPALRGWVSEQREDGTRDLLVVLTPPAVAPIESAGDTDAVFVLDTSGSMKGKKIESLRDGVTSALEILDGRDSFSLIRFSHDSSSFESGLIAADGSARDSAKGWLTRLEADGGTKLTAALTEAIAVASTGDKHPIVVVVTDGAISDAEPVEKILAEEGGNVRVLFLGIGAEPQSAVLQRLAALARGEAAFAQEAGQVAGVLSRLFGSFSSPLAWDLQLEAPGTELVSTWPKRVPDLYEGRPVTLFLRVRGELPTNLRLRGASVEGLGGLDRSVDVDQLTEAPGLRGPRSLDGQRRRGR